jgi:outer membrane biogenesis lipoprotein LolB
MKVFSAMQNRFKVLLSLGVTAILFACSLYPDVNRDPAKNNKATFQRDAIDCAQSYPDSGSGVHVKQRIACMNLKGWY